MGGEVDRQPIAFCPTPWTCSEGGRCGPAFGPARTQYFRHARHHPVHRPPLLIAVAAVLLVAAVWFPFGNDSLGMAAVVGVVVLLVLDAALFALVAWSSARPGPRWRVITVALLAVNVLATLLDQVGPADIAVIVLLGLTAVAVVMHAPRR